VSRELHAFARTLPVYQLLLISYVQTLVAQVNSWMKIIFGSLTLVAQVNSGPPEKFIISLGSLCSNKFNVPDLNLHIREKYEENPLIAWSNGLACVQKKVGDLMFLVFMKFCLLATSVEC
jgi:hypothetical protein